MTSWKNSDDEKQIYVGSNVYALNRTESLIWCNADLTGPIKLQHLSLLLQWCCFLPLLSHHMFHSVWLTSLYSCTFLHTVCSITYSSKPKKFKTKFLFCLMFLLLGLCCGREDATLVQEIKLLKVHFWFSICCNETPSHQVELTSQTLLHFQI